MMDGYCCQCTKSAIDATNNLMDLTRKLLICKGRDPQSLQPLPSLMFQSGLRKELVDENQEDITNMISDTKEKKMILTSKVFRYNWKQNLISEHLNIELI